MKAKPVKGGVLRPNAATLARFRKPWLTLIDQMTRETTTELLALFNRSDVLDNSDLAARIMLEEGFAQQPMAVAMDASLADQAQSIINQLMGKFTVLFDRAATGIVSNMTADTLRDSQTGLQRSLKDISKSQLTLKPTEQLKQVIDAAAQEATGLIKRVPADYLPMVQGDVMRSITTGNGLEDLEPALRARNVKVKNWAENVSKDQTRKVYANINKTRMADVGIDKYEWIHSGGSNKPRQYHIDQDPAGLNGRICSLKDPPIIDERTGERGIPGQLPYCGCTMRPIVELDLEDEE